MDKNKLAVSLFDRYAQRYQEKYMDQGRYHESLRAFCEAVQPTDASILELACGPGNVTRYLLQMRPDFQILATDLAPQMLVLAKANNLTVETQCLDCRNILSLEQKFDAIAAAFVLPYLNTQEVIRLFEDAAASLQQGGLLYISTMAGSSSLSGWQGPSDGGSDKLYMYYHEEAQLLAWLAQKGFVLMYEQHLPIEEQKAEPYDLILIARKAP